MLFFCFCVERSDTSVTMPPPSDKELEERLATAGKSLAQPPSSLDELLHLLDVSLTSPSHADCLAFVGMFALLIRLLVIVILAIAALVHCFQCFSTIS